MSQDEEEPMSKDDCENLENLLVLLEQLKSYVSDLETANIGLSRENTSLWIYIHQRTEVMASTRKELLGLLTENRKLRDSLSVLSTKDPDETKAPLSNDRELLGHVAVLIKDFLSSETRLVDMLHQVTLYLDPSKRIRPDPAGFLSEIDALIHELEKERAYTKQWLRSLDAT